MLRSYHHISRTNRPLSLMLLAALIFAAIVAVSTGGRVAAATTTTNADVQQQQQNINNDSDRTSIITMPLVPHREQKARRRLEKGGGEINSSMSKQQQQEEQERVRSHYGRRHLVEGENAEDNVADNNNNNNNNFFHPEQIAVLYQGYGTHYVDLWCGTPSQRQTVIVDTGSGVTAFPCSGCSSDCGVPKYHASPLFVERDSSSFKKLTCQQCLRGTCRKYGGTDGGGGDECHIGMSYQEGSSWSAYEAVDSCYVGGPHVAPTADDGGVDAMDPSHAPAFAFDMKFGCQTHLTGLFITQVRDDMAIFIFLLNGLCCVLLFIYSCYVFFHNHF
jgi:Xylanase inhibitor N-terminal